MSFGVIGIIFFIFGISLAFNIGGVAEHFFRVLVRVNPTTGTATPKTLRFVGAFWIPLGAFFITVGFLR